MNCRNCGAPHDGRRCEHCGTWYETHATEPGRMWYVGGQDGAVMQMWMAQQQANALTAKVNECWDRIYGVIRP